LPLAKPLVDLLQQEITSRSLPDDFIQTIERCYLPVARQIATARDNQKPTQTFMVSFNGAQGSGKSTITAFLRLLLMHQFALNTLDISIDDFYRTHAQRVELSQTVHPLLITRGVPGTHDIDLALQTFDCLRHCDLSNPCPVPLFDKATDDRCGREFWREVTEPVDIVLFEGWCNHAPPQSQQELDGAINELERNEDADGVWRAYVNEQLKLYRRLLFSQADFLVFLQVPSFEKVYEWRGLQEKKLAASSQGDNHAVMNGLELKRFIQHYERITRQCLESLPQQADVILKLDDNHIIQSMEAKTKEAGHV